MKTRVAASLADYGEARPRMNSTMIRRSLLAAALALFAGGCYSAECAKMGFSEGTPEHARCMHHLNEELTQQLNKLSEQLDKTSQQMKKKTAKR